MSGYSPTTAYRSVWAPVPVTQYRPVGYVNPLSTGTQTNMLPCSSSEWQARRVPYTSYQPSSLFSGGSGWQGGQWLPVASASNAGVTTAGYPGAQVSYDQSTPWEPVTSTTTNYSASPISSGWTPVGSGVSYAAPGGSTGLLSIGDSTVTSAGYRDRDAFSPSRVTPLPSSMDSSSWKAVSDRDVTGYDANWRPSPSSQQSDDYCKNCPPAAADNSLRATDWEPVEPSDQRDRDTTYQDRRTDSDSRARDYRDRDYQDYLKRRNEYDRSRTRITPADRAPELPQTQERRRYDLDYDTDRARRDDLYRWEQFREKGGDGLTPVRRPNSETETMYRPPRTFGVNNQPVRPAITRQADPARQADPYYQRKASDGVYRQQAPALPKTQPVPYLKPIPDLNRARRQQNVQRPVTPIPSSLDDTQDRTAHMNQVAPERRAVPIDWHVVDIDRQGGLTRVKSPEPKLTPVVRPSSSRPSSTTIQLAPPQNVEEGGWRRVR